MQVAEDKHGLLGVISNASHRPLLLLALEATRDCDDPVLELGMGPGSTPYLHDYCAAEGRRLVSLDNDAEWASAFASLARPLHRVEHLTRWQNLTYAPRYSVVLIDHAPERRRHVDVAALADRAAILVLHDTEPESPGYFYDRVWGLFRYRASLVVEPGRYMQAHAHAAAVSNTIDVTTWRGTGFSDYPFVVS